MKAVCFTGHRHIPEIDYPQLEEALVDTVEQLIERGAEIFRAGGAMGFDTLAALTVLSLKKKHPHIRLELVLPCPTQTRGWEINDLRLYEQILGQADSHRYVSTGYYRGVLQMRNRALVDGSDVCVAYLRNSHGGGTAFTAAYALKQGLELINLQDALLCK